MFLKRERKQGKIRFRERRKMMFHLFNKYLVSIYYAPGPVLEVGSGGES